MADLPPELIQEIIRISTTGDPTQAATLALVSRGFNDCVRPVLCSTLMYYHTSPACHWPVPKDQLPQWLEVNGKYVHSLMWGQDVKDLPNLLNLCPNLTNLAIWSSEEGISTILPSLSTIRLSRLSVNLEELFSQSNFSAQEASHDGFQTITHLDVVYNVLEWKEISGVASMPSLTHICFSSTLLDADVLGLFSRILRKCKLLKVLIFVSGVDFPDEPTFRALQTKYKLLEFDFKFKEEIDDPRVVLIDCECIADWVYGAIGREDMWAFADKIVTERMKEREKWRS